MKLNNGSFWLKKECENRGVGGKFNNNEVGFNKKRMYIRCNRKKNPADKIIFPCS